jgi:hypothetical protein
VIDVPGADDDPVENGTLPTGDSTEAGEAESGGEVSS